MFDYEIAWFDKLIEHTATLLASGAPVVFTDDFKVMPTERGIDEPECWTKDELSAPDVRRTIHPDETIYTVSRYFRNAYAPHAGLWIDPFLFTRKRAEPLVDAGGRSKGTSLEGTQRPRIDMDLAC